MSRWRRRLACLLTAAGVLVRPASAATEALPSWNDGAPKRAILEFVAATTRKGAPTFVSPAERIAVFDNDGTLWAEQPMYVQLAFTLDRVKALAPQYPSGRRRSRSSRCWRETRRPRSRAASPPWSKCSQPRTLA
jgi:hypothetical protein